MSGASRWLAVPAVIWACVSPAPAAEGQPALQPYQMVRSLQLLQDQLAGGDHAALPMQKKLLELIDQRLRKADEAVFAEKRNVRAVLIYGMSGGNPATLAEFMRNASISDENRTVLKGVLAYLHGNTQSAQAQLGDIDPKALPPELGAFLALVKGSVTAGSDPSAALKQLDLARLLSPGTLIEEAAIRRSLALEASSGQARRFFRAASQYVRRFLRSPYASQFADSFVTGILELHAELDYAAIDEITAMMDADQRKVIYLRIARRAAIEGLTDLSAYAAQKAGSVQLDEGQDVRAQLYAILSHLTSENVESVVASLGRIDRRQLTESDVRLLEAAERIASEMTARPKPEVTAAVSPDERQPASAESVAPEQPKLDAAPAASDPVAPSAEATAASDDSTASILNETRAKLDAIDKLLEDAR